MLGVFFFVLLLFFLRVVVGLAFCFVFMLRNLFGCPRKPLENARGHHSNTLLEDMFFGTMVFHHQKCTDQDWVWDQSAQRYATMQQSVTFGSCFEKSFAGVSTRLRANFWLFFWSFWALLKGFLGIIFGFGWLWVGFV